MEQMDILLSVPTISKTSVSSTPKTAASEDDKSFSDLYEQNISDTKTSSVDTTKNCSKKDSQPVNKSDDAEKSVDDSKNETNTDTEKSETTVDQKSSAFSWLNLVVLTTDGESVESDGTMVDTTNVSAIAGESMDLESNEVQSTAMVSDVETSDNASTELSSENISFSDIQTEADESSDETIQVPVASVNSSTDTVQNATSQTEIVEETNEVEIPVSSIATEPTNVNNISAQTTVVDTKQTVDSTVVENSFAAEMSDDLIQNNVQQNIMNQIENSLGKIVKTGNNEIRIQLEPEQLGVLNIRIIAGKDGTQVVFKADSHQSSQLIAAQTDSLKSMLTEAGIKVDQIVVNDFSFSQDNFQNQQTFEQQSGKGSKFYKNINGSIEQMDTMDGAYEMSQTIVGLNYLV